MKQKTEASQAVDEPVLPHLPRAVAYRHTMDNTEGLKGNKPVTVFCATKPNPFGIPGLDYSASFPVTTETLFTATQMKAYARAALKAQPAPTEAPNFERKLQAFSEKLRASQVPIDPELSKVISENLWDLYAGDDEAPTEAAQGNTSNNSSSSQLSGNSGELTQGEDSARLDWIDANEADVLRAFYPMKYLVKVGWKEVGEGTSVREALDRARASAETGGVKS